MISFSSVTRRRMTHVRDALCSGSCLRTAAVFWSWFVSPIRAFPAAGFVRHAHECWRYCCYCSW